MALPIKRIFGIVPAVQAAALVKRNADFALKKRRKAGGFTKLAADNIVGTSLIAAEAEVIGGI